MSEIEVVIGRIGKPHGIRGEVTIDVRSDEPDRRFAAGNVLRLQPPKGSALTLRSVTVVSTRWHQGIMLANFAEANDRNTAETLRGSLLHATIPADASPEDPDEFYDHQLVGLAVFDLDGTQIGVVTSLVHGGAQDLLAIKATDGRPTLVPFVKALVPEVDVSGNRVVVADRPGLVAPMDDE
ncbi:ribosome maturation factor RimM [Nocardioides sp. Bht2]|uniref:ribosome maturation factor RimM n=1 Tax=Nocardioides sp. Bht2 TaxID=3392297 RepID=UPI0039B38F63